MESFDLAWRFVMFQTCSFDWVRGNEIWRCETSCFFRLRYDKFRVRRVRRSLDSVSAATLVHAFVLSGVDYCNAVFAGAPKTDRLQRVLNAAARVDSDTRKFDRGLSRIMRNRAWLAGCSWTNQVQAWHLMDHCTSVSDVAYRQRLRSASSHEVSVPRHRLPMDVVHLPLLARLSGTLCPRTCVYRGFWGQLQAVTEDVFICAVLVCSAH